MGKTTRKTAVGVSARGARQGKAAATGWRQLPARPSADQAIPAYDGEAVLPSLQETALAERPKVEAVQKPEAVPAQESWVEPVPRSHHGLKLMAGTAATLVVVSAAWLATGYALAKTNVGTVKLQSRAGDGTYTQALTAQAAAYRLTVRRPDGQQASYGLKDLGMSVDTAGSITKLRQSQHSLQARVLWYRPVRAVAVIHTDETALNNFIASKTTIIAQPSQDAVLAINNGQISVTDAVTGKQYGLADSRDALLADAANLKPASVKLKQLAVNPALTSAMLEPYKEKLQAIMAAPVSFSIQGKTVTAPASEVASWLEITPQPKSQKVDITVNSGKVAAYIDKLSSGYNHPPKAEIVTKQSDGSDQVLVAGVSGVTVSNESAVATAVAGGLLDAKGSSQQLNVATAAYKTINTGDYDKWIETDLTTKRLYAYEHGNLVNTILVTAGAPATPTVTGQYAIYSKYTQQNMRGSNADGSSYYQPNVRWINYFYKDYAIHGNYWRPLSYFGNINSSHGCISAVNDQAQWVYNWAPIGTPVIVHT